MYGKKILVVDDQKSVLVALELLLQDEFEEVVTLSNPNQLIYTLTTNDFDVVILDMNFSAGINTGNEGLYWLNKLLEYNPSLSVILLTAYGDVELAVKAIRKGALDFVLKPWDNDKLMATLRMACDLQKSKRKIEALNVQKKGITQVLNSSKEKMIGISPSVKNLRGIIEKVSGTDANILIVGENGTGKELIAREIHLHSSRCDNALVTVDLGALTESLFESEMFGHCKGAFTDAREDRIGRFELAHEGTLFLDEIGNLSLSAQAKLLSVLQNRKVVRVGGNNHTEVDFRLICATNCDLSKMVAEGTFREDLFYRINTIEISVPPLRNRNGDVEILADYFLKRFANKYGRTGLILSKGALERLNKYNWPGNVRELRHIIERAVILSDSDYISPDLFAFELKAEREPELSMGSLEEMERIMIARTIRQHNGNMSAAAKQLDVSRATLYNKIKKYDL